MKTIIKSTLAVAAICFLAGWVCRESTVTAPPFPNVKTTGYQTDAQNEAAALLTAQIMERLPEISTH